MGGDRDELSSRSLNFKFHLNLFDKITKMSDKKVINIGNFEVEITKKRMKNLSLRITDDGKIKLSAPKYASNFQIEEFLKSKIEWVQKNIKNKNTNKYQFLGTNLNLVEKHSYRKTPQIELHENTNLIIKINSNLPLKTKEKHIDNWYKDKLKEISSPFFEKWEKELGVNKSELKIRKMSGKWGYCEFKNRVICLNSELLKKELIFIEYVVLHELCHLIVPNHGKEFKNLLDYHMPEWRNLG